MRALRRPLRRAMGRRAVALLRLQGAHRPEPRRTRGRCPGRGHPGRRTLCAREGALCRGRGAARGARRLRVLPAGAAGLAPRGRAAHGHDGAARGAPGQAGDGAPPLPLRRAAGDARPRGQAQGVRVARLERALRRPRRRDRARLWQGRLRVGGPAPVERKPHGTATAPLAAAPLPACPRTWRPGESPPTPTQSLSHHTPSRPPGGHLRRAPMGRQRRRPRLCVRHPRGARLPARRDAPAGGGGAQPGGCARQEGARQRQVQVRLLPRVGAPHRAPRTISTRPLLPWSRPLNRLLPRASPRAAS